MGLGVILIFNFIYQHSSKSELGNIFVSLGRAIMKRTLIAGFSQIILIISLACFSCETQKMPASLLSLFFFVCACQQRSRSQAFQAYVETGYENRDMSRRHALFREESLGAIDAKVLELFRNGSEHEFYRLKALITLEQVKASMVGL